ncbi:symmetrical bis(5'-nucleosyl)-tetraphosphatase [Glaciecola sp. XM2]|jgi:bis(5'-nucleosyl)-tetraphosphatase (symmetrical)|uniref:symmetrical bis(5'-nucleosyl)-tetraphosphatase n=1 Tax=Glaciecola sp. XM2 TaxID=1914931 RepID=UPI001BDDE22D|nr:symmetrical bis(5'-nucleosyl)-tetraphosphatase [Glaciecola sp. XM2]MBT1451051.1 symmetrical bis(5'-nucleosyl)-tetraphosphatase [Glaciecola sp. XM2]
MRNFVVGDIQGCYRALKRVLKKADFDPAADKLWAVGDLVARGPDSLSTLSFCRDLGPHFETVLGNHDLHLIAIAFGLKKPKAQDKLKPLIDSKEFSNIIDWLLTKPLAVKPAKKTLITHAGLHPKWSIKDAIALSNEVQAILQGEFAADFLKDMYGNEPDKWSSKLSTMDRHRFVVNACTRMRYLRKNMALEFDTKCHPSSAPTGLAPWFMFENPSLTDKHTLLFGHWASLLGQVPASPGCKADVRALDTGYVWGNTLSLTCLETKKTIQYHA